MFHLFLLRMWYLSVQTPVSQGSTKKQQRVSTLVVTSASPARKTNIPTTQVSSLMSLYTKGALKFIFAGRNLAGKNTFRMRAKKNASYISTLLKMNNGPFIQEKFSLFDRTFKIKFSDLHFKFNPNCH